MERKDIVQGLSEHFQVKPQYLGALSFAYKIKTGEETYMVDREGKITTAAGEEVTLEGLLNSRETETTESVAPAEEAQTQDCEVKISLDGHSGRTLRNLVNMIYSKQPLIKKALGLTDNIVEEDFSRGVNEAKIETLEDFQTALKDIGEKSCPGITFDFERNTITLNIAQAPEKLQAVTQLFTLIDENARAQKYSAAKVKPTDNEKYTFRTWLLRLGMIGDEYKEARKGLLKNLSGNAAFKKRGQEE